MPWHHIDGHCSGRPTILGNGTMVLGEGTTMMWDANCVKQSGGGGGYLGKGEQ